VLKCKVTGRAIPIAQRGDGIRLYASPRSCVQHCTVDQTRDVILWFSEYSQFLDNSIRHARYGLHLMNTHDGVCERNVIADASVGIFSMYSNAVVLRHNRIGPVRGPSGYGIGLKDTDAFRLEENVIGDARVGIFDDTSPLRADAPGLIAGNWVLWCDAALSFMPSVNGVTIAGNAFIENASQVEIRGGGKLQGNEWTRDGRGNYWSDYDGFESHKSGTGATPYRAMALYEALTDAHPDLKLFEGGLAARTIDWGARVVPLVAPEPKVEDPSPLVAPPPLPDTPGADAAGGSARVALVGAALVVLGLGALLSLGRLA
jgi:nitrous oxidase accessory protein